MARSWVLPSGFPIFFGASYPAGNEEVEITFEGGQIIIGKDEKD